MVERIGIDHVAVGTYSTQDQPLSFWHYIASQQGTKYPSTFSDLSLRYEELSFQPKGLDTLAEFPNLAEALMKRGYASADIVKILGGGGIGCEFSRKCGGTERSIQKSLDRALRDWRRKLPTAFALAWPARSSNHLCLSETYHPLMRI